VKLRNKVALITGGTSGIGLEAAKLFRDEGARVIVSGVNPARLQRHRANSAPTCWCFVPIYVSGPT
jgi:NAD(P)-dependent dehydrogenase (short-subunit alcohol dehydrogenase family)